MSTTRFMVIGTLAGVMLVMTSGWLITGFLCHRFQKATPLTWRAENWHQHALAVVWSAIGGGAMGWLDARVSWGHASLLGALGFAGLVWTAVGGPAIATMATYVNLHRIVVAGLLVEWLLFAAGVSLACFACAI